MSFKFLLLFGIGLAVYLAVVGIIALVKRIKNKKLVKKDKEAFENDKQNKN